PISIDFAKVMARKDKVRFDARKGNEDWLAGMQGLTFIRGHARFESPTEIRVGEERLSAGQIFLNVGGRAVVPDFPGVGDVPHLDNVSMMELTEVPKHLIVVGGSYIGLEFAQMFRRFGSDVTVVEKGPRLIARED